ncbi:hypothetical protein MAMC_00988 [Methylacidimicrobium cyclopophantes]|uniref:Endonuclease GajA/Old nuclease/RecF-like AAA domain-containing protein n=1 Tax=Methylacidimicrobium cyclopophantes TaxID=1041766 RepID=A0A5E6MLA2_9BACT|nr:hypothetical protein MAMC_00988 [Methylacidimicrobium cyclopophantes]
MIRRIRLRNFLSFPELNLPLRSTNVLVGPNRSGKSNLLVALRFLLRALAAPQPAWAWFKRCWS